MDANSRTFRLEELAAALGLRLRGDPDRIIRSVATLSSAAENDATFLANAAYKSALASTRAGVVVLNAEAAENFTGNVLVSDNVYSDWARVVELLHPQPAAPPGVHPSAVIGADADIHPSAHIGAQAVIGARVRVGKAAVVGPGCVIEDDVQLGEASRLVGKV